MGNGGVVINVASVSATVDFPGVAACSAAKAAVDRLTRSAALESGKLGYGVRVNCVHPGFIPTTAYRRSSEDAMGTGDFASVYDATGNAADNAPTDSFDDTSQIGTTVVYLASDAARLVTGAVLPVDGGLQT
ncbi:SDR family oxidoreductase [Fodinicola acaciae]|uniref:SDR family oxidoreductase n=1 Tax=Fodinicola acaciae TaxID=2681555 RepID=UPI0031B59E17